MSILPLKAASRGNTLLRKKITFRFLFIGFMVYLIYDYKFNYR